MAEVTIRTSDGKVYKNPEEVHIPRNKNTEMFYRIVDQYTPQPKTKEKTAG